MGAAKKKSELVRVSQPPLITTGPRLISIQDVVSAFLQRQNENTRVAYEKELRRISAWLDVDSFDELMPGY